MMETSGEGLRAQLRHLGTQLMGAVSGVLWLAQGSSGFHGVRIWVWVVGTCQEFFVVSETHLEWLNYNFMCVLVMHVHRCDNLCVKAKGQPWLSLLVTCHIIF